MSGADSFEKTVLDDGSGRPISAAVRRLRVLGRGRAANAVLVDLETPEGVRKVVEKHFVPAGLTRGIYKAFFGAPFPYGTNRDAALACLHRRRVAGALLQAEEKCRVAEALYVRQCSGGHWVLGTEWIQGRSVAPPKPEEGPEKGSEPGEMSGLLHQMRRMEQCLLRSGLIGSGWQVATAAIVSTANLLRTPEGEFVCIDLESGIPAVLAPRYLWMSLSGAPFPMFDDLDEKKLLNYLDLHREDLRKTLGPDGITAFEASTKQLIHHTHRWKQTELAPGRHRFRLLTDRDLRDTVRSAFAERWREEGRLDDDASEHFRESRFLFLHPLFVSGMIPTRFGKLFHRLIGNRPFRARFLHTLLHLGVLDAELRAYQLRRTELFLRERRIPASGIDRLKNGLRSLFPFLLNDFVAGILPARFHRYLSDWSELGAALKLAILALFSERIQEHLAYSFVEHATAKWKGLGRLDDSGRETLIREIRGGEAPEYARGFGTHLALKFFEPVTSGIKVVGVGLLATNPWNPLGYILIVNTSVFRVIVVTYRWLRRQDRKTSYAVAFAISPIPIFGTLAFPFQFYHRRPWLGRFLIRSSMSSLAGRIPIYGGSGTRLEHALVRFSTPLTALVAAIIWPLKWLDRQTEAERMQGLARVPNAEGGRSSPSIERALTWFDRPEEVLDLCAPHSE
ncbi:MAG: hypothetical protein V1495_11595 [Pseudomonadota bacterium]